MASNRSGFSTTPLGRARPSAFDMNASSASISSMNGDGATADLLREQQIERDRLQMDNFNLVRRVAHLEERLTSMQSLYSEDFEAELLQKRAEIEEKDAKIRQQTETIMRALEAIEQLRGQLAEKQTELERTRAESNQVEEVEMMRHVLAKTEEELERRVHRVREVESELASVTEESVAVRTRLEETVEVKQRMEAELNQLRQKLQQLDQQHTKGAMQVEHLKSIGSQREKQIDELSGRLEQVSQEKQHMEAKYQAQMKRMEDQMRAELEKLKQDGDKYRNEYLKVNGERERLQFERQRLAAELENANKDMARYQSEWERVAKDIDRLNGEVESARLQNAKLSATCEHQSQTLESYKTDRESALDNLHNLEREASEWRKLSSEREVTAKTLEMRCQNAEAEVKRLQERLEAATTRNNYSTNERLGALEQSKNALEAQNFDLRKNLASLQHQMESLQTKCRSYESQLNEEASKAKEYKERLIATERELRQRMAHGEQLERELAQLTNSSVSESARVQQYSEQISRVTNERNQYADTLTAERARLESSQKTCAALEAQNQQLMNQFMSLAKEIRGIVDFGDHELSYRSLDALLKEAKLTLQRHFKAEADVLMRRWQEQSEAARGDVDRLSSQLHSCHVKIENLQRSTLHAKDDVKSIDRSWLKKYESLRSETESSRRSLEDALRSEKIKSAQLEASLSQARGDLDLMTQARNGTMSDLERDMLDLKESNRLLLVELQERRRSAEHARKQYLRSVAENKDLLRAADILKDGIMDRDKQIENFKAIILRTTQQLQRGGSMVEVKQKLLEQLDQTQYMVNETYKKWSHSDIGMGLNGLHGRSANNGADGDVLGLGVQLDEYICRLGGVCDRWREYIQQSREMHRRYSEAWRSAALSFGKGKERPAWVDEIERKCSRHLSETVRVSETMRDIVEDIVNALQHARPSSDRKHRRSRSTDHAPCRSMRDHLDLSPLQENNANDDALSLEHFNGDFDSGDADLNGSNANGHDVLFINRGKRVSTSRSSRTSVSRGGASAIYGHSLASLSRIGDELKVIERKIKTYPDE